MTKPTDADSEAEAWVLTTEAGRALLSEVAEVERPGPSDLSRWRKTEAANVVAAAIRLTTGRRRGAAKFSRATSMWLDPTGLEQATVDHVPHHVTAAGQPDQGTDRERQYQRQHDLARHVEDRRADGQATGLARRGRGQDDGGIPLGGDARPDRRRRGDDVALRHERRGQAGVANGIGQ